MSRSVWPWPATYDAAACIPARRHRMHLRPVAAARDAALLQQWFCSERGRFWVMPDKSLAGIRAHYARMQAAGHACAFLGHARGQPAFLLECYDPAADSVAAHYQVAPGDLGLHLFVAPPVIHIPHFTRAVFRFALTFMFEHLQARRIVVEPDVENLRVHALNRQMGFREVGRIALPDKMALLALCTHDDFLKSPPTEPAP